MKGKITASTILEQCKRMSNDNIWAFFEFNPHLAERKQVSVNVKRADINAKVFYNTWEESNYSKSLAKILSDLIKIEEGEWNE